MSNVSTVHDIKPFKAGDKALSDQRLAKIGYKKTKDQPNPLPSVCVSVPPVNSEEIRENLTALLPYIGTLLEGTQDKIIRARYEATAGALKIIQDSEISVSACISFLHAEANGSRLTIDAIEKWFDATLAERVTVWIGTKLGYDLDSLTTEQMGTMQRHCKIYRDIMTGLSSNRTILAQKQIVGLRGALDLAEDSTDPMAVALTTALDTVEGKNAEDFI
jgi:hypothetical protein